MKIDMGYLHTIRPNGTKIPNDKRVEPLNTHNEDMNNDFFKEYNEENIVIPFSVYLNNSYIYGFDYTLKRIENIDMSYMSIVGDMDITKTIGNPPSFMRTYSPKIKSDVILKFDFDKNVLKYTRNPKGLVIRPALNVDGANNEWWNRLVLYASDYKKGIQRYGRQ